MARAAALDTLLEIASEQGGYITSAQATKLGLGPNELPDLARAGDVRRIRRGVYAMRHAHNRAEDELAAWLSIDRERLPWERDDVAVAVVSHSSAAALHDVGTIIPQHPELTVPRKHRSASRGTSIELHVAPLDARDWGWLEIDGVRIPVTTPARTVVDLLLAGEEPSYIERAIAEAIADQRLARGDLIDAAQRRRQRNQRLVQRVQQLIEDVAP